MTFLPFILRRARRHWQILLTLSLGVILTTALLASGPLLVNTVIEMGLYLTFQSSGVADGNLRLATSTHSAISGQAQIDQAAFQTLDSEIQAPLRAALGEHLDRVTQTAESKWMFPWVGGQLATDQRVNLRFYQGIQNHVEYVAGEWPGGTSGEPIGLTQDRPNIIRAVISDGMARSFTLRVGDRLPLSLEHNSAEPDAWIEVTGIVSPKNPRDPYWFGEFGPLTSQSTQHWSAQYSAIVPVDAFFPAVASLFPGDEVDLAWHALLRHDAFSAADIEPLQAQLAGLNAQLGAFSPPVTLHTGIPDILASFEKQIESIRVPLYILIAEVMLLTLYYVTMVAALSMRQVEREFAVMRSRGTSGWQIFRIQLVETLIILAVAFLSGPGLGAGLVKGLSWAGPLADVRPADWDLSLSQSAWQAAGLGTLACLAGLLLPLGPALRRSIVTHQHMVTRSTRPPWWQRLYLDVFVLVGGLVLLWRLRLYGEMTTGGPGGAHLDWLLLLSPVVMLLGAATILLRVFPLVLRALAFIAARGPGLAGALALWQASRNPTHVAQLVLLLTLAIALGNLSTGLNATLDQSEYDRAYYLAGNDLRLTSQRAVPLVDLQSAPGVLQLSGAWRGQGTVAVESAQMHPGVEVLAIEPNSFAKVTTYRDDFSDQSMDELSSHLAVQEGQHPSLLLLPGQPAKFGLWVWGMPEDKAELASYQRWIDGDGDAERVGVVAKLQTAQGELFTARLQRPETTGQAALQTDRFTLQMNVGGRDVGLRFRFRPDNQGWYYFEGSLPALPSSNYPLSLHSLWFQNQATRLGEPIAKGTALVIDDLTVVDAETQEPQIVEDFEGLNRTLFLNVMEGSSIHQGLTTFPTGWASRSGKSGQLVSMSYTRPGQTYPLRLRQVWTSAPLPALASPAFMEATELKVGDVALAQVNSAEIDFRIVGTVRYFPTMYEQLEAGYLITSRDLLLALFNETLLLSTNPNEVFIETDGSTLIDNLSSMVPMLSQSWEAESVRKTLKANPLALGLRSVTFFGSVLTILLSLVGFATYFYLSVRQRETLYGVMRALGMSSRQMYGSIVLEQAVLILTGLALGTGLGVLLNQITLPRLPVSLADRPPIPPFVPRADWLAVGSLYLLLAVAFLVILGIVTALLWRARIHRILRIGQE
ncbi:MAG: ABC transporter permease [Chloroflexota bacterium]|nr:ABC transporter permease [Chloroflexota bacterium]